MIMNKADIRWLDDPGVFRVNQLEAHSDHSFFANDSEMQAGRSSLTQSLNGIWKFRYSSNADERPEDFHKEDFNDSSFDEIKVPGHIELSNFDKIHYINTMYPWEGHEYKRPSGVYESSFKGAGLFHKSVYNPVGSYRQRFDLEEGLKDKRVVICFEGVEEAFYLWLNGNFVGYAEDSFTPSEFDLTPYIREKDNILAVEVHKRSSAAFLEDQDFFRLFGIFRNVILYAKPAIHVEDLWIRPILTEDNESGILEVDLKISSICKGTVQITLQDQEEQICWNAEDEIEEMILFKSKKIEKVIPWDHTNPYLYTVLVKLYNENGSLVEIVPYKVGFRRIEIKNKIMLLNGKRLIINGVNRHEWSASNGRAIGREEMEWDMSCIVNNNINAVRTCHYPNQIPWYYMCDENGIYLMAESNLESHGSWQKAGSIEPSWNVPGKFPEWKEVALDRQKTNFETFKNHTSILFWSLGNESYAEENMVVMNAYFKEKDNSRLIHYEGVFNNRGFEDRISDVESRMYAFPEEIIDYLDHNPKKPFILCEYMHDMGNSLGGLQSYMSLLEKYEMYQGGFIWDFIDQALWVTDEVTGQQVLRYGGDFDDRPSDYEFSGNGIVFAGRVEKPAMQEVRYYYGLYK
ncbi:glycoside hydrolase family 2 TIM barrel-domain containing protein [Anaerosporobacter sp.]